MIKIVKEEIEIDKSLVSRLNVICDFCNTTPIIENGSIRKIVYTYFVKSVSNNCNYVIIGIGGIIMEKNQISFNEKIVELLNASRDSSKSLSELNNELSRIATAGYGVVEPGLERILEGLSFGALVNAIAERQGSELSAEQVMAAFYATRGANGPRLPEGDNFDEMVNNIIPSSSNKSF